MSKKIIATEPIVTYEVICPYTKQVTFTFDVPVNRTSIAPQNCNAHNKLPLPSGVMTVTEYIDSVLCSGFNLTLPTHQAIIRRRQTPDK
ncbi:hypothetical protein HYV64_05145 [Candidatus Shapirobacteria bacterium]|nr:hypothetical protein [Candidatus Shapirobacteria bacterium]